MSIYTEPLNGLNFTEDLQVSNLLATEIQTTNIEPFIGTDTLNFVSPNINLRSDNVVIGTNTNNAGVCNVNCNVLRIGDGTTPGAGVPELLFNSDTTGPDTGIRGLTDEMRFITGGSDRFRMTNSGLHLPDGSVTQPSLYWNSALQSGLSCDTASGGTRISTAGADRVVFGFNRINFFNASLNFRIRQMTGASPQSINNNDHIVSLDNNTWTGTYNIQLANTSVPIEGMTFVICDPYKRGDFGAGRILRFDATIGGTTTAIYVNGVNNRKWEFNHAGGNFTMAEFFCSRITGGNVYLHTEANLNPVP